MWLQWLHCCCEVISQDPDDRRVADPHRMETPPSLCSRVNSLPFCPLIDFCCRQEVLNFCQRNKFKERLRASPQPAHISLWRYEKEATRKPTHQRRLHLSGMPTNEPCNGLTETQDKQMGRETSPPPSSHHITSSFLISRPSFLHPAVCLFAEGMSV